MAPTYLHRGSRHGDPLVAVQVEPRQTQVVSAVEVRVLAVREPPARLVVARAVRMARVSVLVGCAELRVVLVGQSVGRVAVEALHAEAIAVALRADHHRLVVGSP